MGELEDLIRTVSEKVAIGEDEVKKKVKEKQRELSGLVSETGAAYIVANELGVKTKNRIIESTVRIGDILPEMKAVSVLGRVKAISPARDFVSKKGIKGKVSNMEIVDNTASIRIAIWNQSDIDKLESGVIKEGQIIQIKNGYVREGYRGGFEINVGNKGKLVENPEEVNETEFPAEDEFTSALEIGKIVPDSSVNVVGRVIRNFGVNEFERDGRTGKVANLVIGDSSGTAKLVLWNEKAEKSVELAVGDIVRVGNGFVKQGQAGLEIQANWGTTLVKNPEGVEVPAADDINYTAGSSNNGAPKERVEAKIADLKEGDKYRQVRGAIVNIFGDNFIHLMCPECNKKVREGQCDKCGIIEKPNKLLIINGTIDDGSGTISVTFFREAAEKLIGVTPEEISSSSVDIIAKVNEALGKEVVVEGSVKRNDYMDRIELNVYEVKPVDAVQAAEKMIGSV
ncbi:MAG: OB-fold nucleic acid binding domain-containing protein [archaeon]|jgi:replication factor A1|nr:OB-fold nucleic acid binding domain-containing protein [archaeon]|tara:strand:- start:2936 stop:4300 length:1365 start_codon:yes stop_codon:yes gene_type:complete